MRFFSLLPLMLAGCSGAAATLPSATLPAATLPAPSRPNAAASEPASSPAPSAFESLHPHCVGRLLWEEAHLALATCSEAAGEVSVEGSWRNFTPSGEGRDPHEIERFEVLGAYGPGVALRYLVNSGGTGDFTGVMVVSIEGTDLVRHAVFAQGDRCNGGLVQAHIEGDALVTTQTITPADVIEASALGRGLRLVAYQHLEASASSCAAHATHRWENGAPTLLDITFPAAPIDQPGWTQNFAHQSCFNALVAARLERGASTLSPSELEAFAGEFASRCVRSGASP